MNERLPAVAVLMSTYNGEKYLKEQLDSIFTQQGVVVKLFVRDDGSSDATMDILQMYAKKYPVEIIQDGENVRPGESFMRLVYKYAGEPDFQYYAFADQDDIWLENKLLTAVEKIKKCSFKGAVLYSSNQYIYIDGKNKGSRYSERQRIDLISHMTKNTIAGCTFVFNKKLAHLAAQGEKPDSRILRYRLHDAWLMLVAITCGKVIYDEASYMLYRIHSNNVVGIKNISFSDKINRVKRMFDNNSSNLRMVTAKELIRLFPQMYEENRNILYLYAKYKESLNDRKSLLLNNDIVAKCQERPIVFRLKVLLGLV